MKLSERESQNIGAACHELNSMYEQLFKSTGLNNFCYARFDKDRRFTILASNDKFQRTYLENDLPQRIYKHYNYDSLTQGKFFCDDIVAHETQQEALDITHACGIRNIMMFNNIQDEYTEIFKFGSPVNANGIRSVYLNHNDFIEDYVTITKKQINKLMQRHAIPSVYLPLSKPLEKISAVQRQVDTNEILAEYSQQHHSSIPLSTRETSCLALLMQGASSKQIADELRISRRTVENNINRVMEKLNVSTRIKLLSQLREEFRFYPTHQIIIQLRQ